MYFLDLAILAYHIPKTEKIDMFLVYQGLRANRNYCSSSFPWKYIHPLHTSSPEKGHTYYIFKNP